jgi:RimJ/RimL family protein N-acetyltransferase
MNAIRELIPQKSEKDLDQLLPAALSIWNDPKNLKYLSFTLIPFSEEQFRQWMSNHLDQGMRYFVEVDTEDNILGVSILKLDAAIGFELYGLAVHSDKQHQGIGKRLADHAVSFAKSLQYHSVEVSVFSDNVPMLRLMIGKGFIPIQIRHRARADGGDILVLCKQLP